MWTIQQTQLIAIAGNVIETKSLTLLNSTIPGSIILKDSSLHWYKLGANPRNANAEVEHPEKF